MGSACYTPTIPAVNYFNLQQRGQEPQWCELKFFNARLAEDYPLYTMVVC